MSRVERTLLNVGTLGLRANDHIKEELAINRGRNTHLPLGGNLVVGVAPISAVFKLSFLIALIVVGSISVGRFWENLSLLCQSFAP